MNTSFIKLLLPTCCLAFLFNFTVYAAVPEEVEVEIKANIEEDLNSTLDKLVDEESLAARFEFDYPVKEPAKTLPAVQDLVDKTVIQLAKEKHPASWIQQELKKEEPRFTLWRESDKVKGMTKEGKEFNGYLREIGNTRIKVDTRYYHFKDLTPETFVHLNSQKAEELRKQIRKRLVNELVAMRNRYARVIRLDQTREIYKQEGYIRVFGVWKAKAEFFRERVAAERERFKKLVENDLVYKHYYNTGYRLFRGEWYTPEEVVELRRKAFIEDELAPDTLMALFDKLNLEGRENIAADDAKTLFGDDDAPGDGGEEKKDDGNAEEDVF